MGYPDYPFTGKQFVTASGAKMHYLDEGPAQPEGTILFVHGNPSWSFLWRRPILALRERFRCLAPDHIGMGLSETPGEDRYRYTLDQRVADLTALIDAVAPEETIHLVAHDWGGMIGLTWALRHRQRLGKVCLMNTAGFGLPADMAMPWQLRFSRSCLGPPAIRGLNAFCRYAVKHCVTRRRLPREVAKAYLAPYGSWHERLPVLRFVQDIPLTAREASWNTVQETANNLHLLAEHELMIAWGLRDFVFTPAFLAEWKRRLPDATYHEYPDCGHYLLEDAHEDLVPKIVAFLTSEEIGTAEDGEDAEDQKA